MAFADGVPEAPLKVVGSTPGRSGTRVTFTPSPATFTMVEFDYATLEHRLRELAFLNSGVKIVLLDLTWRGAVKSEFKYEGGLKAFVQYLDRARPPLFPEPIFIKTDVKASRSRQRYGGTTVTTRASSASPIIFRSATAERILPASARH